jgi:molybdate transport system ATP-binding protein
MELNASFQKTFKGGATVRGELRLDLEVFGLTVLFGQSGCGKTTFLRCLAGLETPEAGAIQAGPQVWFHAAQGLWVPAWERGIGLVFQDSMLFPHLDVAGNIAYGLKGWSRAARSARVAEMIDLMGLDGLAHRGAKALSGGQKQRVALARALAPRPRLVLLDEPFGALDRASAELLRHNLRQILQKLAVPTILVTHSPVEALALGDRMLLMEEGRIIQDGPPATILAGLEGTPEEEMGTVVRTRVLGRVEGLLHLAVGSVELFAPDPGGTFQEAYACIRGEGVALESGPHGPMTPRNRLSATITAIEPLGALTRVRLDAGFPLQALLTTWASQDLQLAPGQGVQALVKASAIRVVPIEA